MCGGPGKAGGRPVPPRDARAADRRVPARLGAHGRPRPGRSGARARGANETAGRCTRAPRRLAGAHVPGAAHVLQRRRPVECKEAGGYTPAAGGAGRRRLGAGPASGPRRAVGGRLAVEVARPCHRASMCSRSGVRMPGAGEPTGPDVGAVGLSGTQVIIDAPGLERACSARAGVSAAPVRAPAEWRCATARPGRSPRGGRAWNAEQTEMLASGGPCRPPSGSRHADDTMRYAGCASAVPPP